MNHSSPHRPADRSPRRHRVLWLGLVVALAALAAGCLFIDHTVSQWFRTHPATWRRLDWVDAFKQLGKAGTPIWLLLFWSCLTNRWRPTVFTIAALILVAASVCPLKAIVRRSRPNAFRAASTSASVPPSELPWHERVSFPSGDTAAVFAVATTFSSFVGRLWTPALFLAAGAVGLLRIASLMHYPSDVAAGALIGILCGLAALRYAAARPSLGQFRIPRRGRGLALVTLIVIMPIISPWVGMASLRVFLDTYGLPLAAVTVVWLAAGWWRAQRSAPIQTATLEERKPGPQSQKVATGDPESRSDFLKEPAS